MEGAERAGGRPLEDRAQREFRAETCPDPGDQPRGEQGVAAQGEEVVVRLHRGDTQQVRHERRHLLFPRDDGRGGWGGRLHPVPECGAGRRGATHGRLQGTTARSGGNGLDEAERRGQAGARKRAWKCPEPPLGVEGDRLLSGEGSDGRWYLASRVRWTLPGLGARFSERCPEEARCRQRRPAACGRSTASASRTVGCSDGAVADTGEGPDSHVPPDIADGRRTKRCADRTNGGAVSIPRPYVYPTPLPYTATMRSLMSLQMRLMCRTERVRSRCPTGCDR